MVTNSVTRTFYHSLMLNSNERAEASAAFEDGLSRVRADMLTPPRDQVTALFSHLDALVASGGRGPRNQTHLADFEIAAQRKAALLRLGSVAANSEQVELYTTIASAPATLTVCEVWDATWTHDCR